jgi:hypothetical protein
MYSCMHASNAFLLYICVYISHVAFPIGCIFIILILLSKIIQFPKMGLHPTGPQYINYDSSQVTTLLQHMSLPVSMHHTFQLFFGTTPGPDCSF